MIYATFPFGFPFSFAFPFPFQWPRRISILNFHRYLILHLFLALLTGGGLSIGSGSGRDDRPEATGSGHTREGDADATPLRGSHQDAAE